MAKNHTASFPVNIAIISSEDDTRSTLEKNARNLGAVFIASYSNADDAVKKLYSEKWDAVMIDWKSKGTTSAIAFISRIRRQKKFMHLPILIVAGPTVKDETDIVKDYACISFITKPVRLPDISETMKSLATESAWYRFNEDQIAQAFAINVKDPKAAIRQISAIIAKSPNPIPLAIMAAEQLADQSKIDDAIALVDHVLRMDGKCLSALSAKSKYLALQGRHREALAILNKAQSIAPKNIERMCMMGDIEISLHHPDKAIAHFQSALGIDPLYEQAQVGLTVAQNFSSISSQQVSTSESSPSIAKILNNLGVQLARQGKLEQAMNYYVMSISFLTAKDLMSKVSFNMGLGYKKQNDHRSARSWFQRAISLSGNQYEKAEKHLTNLPEDFGEEAIGKLGSTETPLSPFEESAMNSELGAYPRPENLEKKDFVVLDKALADIDLTEESVDVFAPHADTKQMQNAMSNLIEELDKTMNGTNNTIDFEDSKPKSA